MEELVLSWAYRVAECVAQDGVNSFRPTRGGWLGGARGRHDGSVDLSRPRPCCCVLLLWSRHWEKASDNHDPWSWP